MGMITLKEWCERNHKLPSNMRLKAINGGFETAVKVGRDWLIDENEPARDRRFKSGQYVGFRDNLGKNKDE